MCFARDRGARGGGESTFAISYAILAASLRVLDCFFLPFRFFTILLSSPRSLPLKALPRFNALFFVDSMRWRYHASRLTHLLPCIFSQFLSQTFLSRF
jgi:hypothetical protein